MTDAWDDTRQALRQANGQLFLRGTKGRERLSASWEHLPDPSADGVPIRRPLPPDKVPSRALRTTFGDPRRIGFRQPT